MTKEELKARLKSSGEFVKMQSDEFCRLAESCNCKEDSGDDCEASMARTLRIHKNSGRTEINVNRKVVERMLEGAGPQGSKKETAK